jgi:hypothetical protein
MFVSIFYIKFFLEVCIKGFFDKDAIYIITIAMTETE